MRPYTSPRFQALVLQLLRDFNRHSEKVDVGQWQGLDVRGDSQKVTWELREAVLAFGMVESMSEAQLTYQPNLPWAEDHFLERVSGKPLNPPPSNNWWPFTQGGHEQHLRDGKFSHTYPERFWPKRAGYSTTSMVIDGVEQVKDRQGIRFEYGDLQDVVTRLSNSPYTRQAYLPVWFPEDTGAPKGERVPCSLGYLFMIRNNKLHVSYHIRSCDFMRHFRDDVYMAVRLAQWMRDEIDLDSIEMGDLTMHIGSFHIFEGDRAMIAHLLRDVERKENSRLLGEF